MKDFKKDIKDLEELQFRIEGILSILYEMSGKNLKLGKLTERQKEMYDSLLKFYKTNSLVLGFRIEIFSKELLFNRTRRSSNTYNISRAH